MYTKYIYIAYTYIYTVVIYHTGHIALGFQGHAGMRSMCTIDGVLLPVIIIAHYGMHSGGAALVLLPSVCIALGMRSNRLQLRTLLGGQITRIQSWMVLQHEGGFEIRHQYMLLIQQSTYFWHFVVDNTLLL